MTESRLPRSTSLAATRSTRSQKSGLAALANSKSPTPTTQPSSAPAPSQPVRTRSKAQSKTSTHRATASISSNAAVAAPASTGRTLRSTRSANTLPSSGSNQNLALHNAKRVAATSAPKRTNSATPPTLSPSRRPVRGHKRQAASVSTAEVAMGMTRSSSLASNLASKLEPLIAGGRGSLLHNSTIPIASPNQSSSTSPADSLRASPQVPLSSSTQSARPLPSTANKRPFKPSTSMMTSTPQRPRRRGVPDTPALSTLLSGEVSQLQQLDMSLVSDTSFNQLTPPRPLKSSTSKQVRSDTSPLQTLTSSKSMNTSKSGSQFAQELGRLRAQRTELEDRLSAMKAEETRLQVLIDKTMQERQAAIDSCAEMENQKNQAIWNGIINACEEAIEAEQDFKATLDSLRVLVMA